MSDQRSIPSLDGLRAVAITLATGCHLQMALKSAIPLVFIARCGSLGVDIFFVISGFLITELLLRELQRDASINLKRFYLRRTLRILPPFYVFLTACAVVHHFQPWVFHWGSFLASATYTWNYNFSAGGWLLGHTWTLAMEEQFYLLWPFILVSFPLRTSLRLAVIIIALSPVLRVITYALFPPLRGHIDMMLPTHLDTLMVGCALALSANLGAFTRLRAAVARPLWVGVSAVMLVVVCPILEERYRGAFYLPFGISITSIGCGIILLYAVRFPRSAFGRILNLAWVRHIGVISYSIYLWQQLFTGERMRHFPLNVVFIILCAEASYWLVEQPVLRLRQRYLDRSTYRFTSVSTSPLIGERTSG